MFKAVGDEKQGSFSHETDILGDGKIHSEINA